MRATPEKGLFDAPVISVSELNRSVRDLLERRFPLGWIAGEISNFKRYDSGHCYFTLKDAGAQVRCVMFRGRAQYLDWQPKEGMQVEVRALVTLYEPRGDFQLNVETMRRAGLGPLFEQFLRVKEKLEREGLFDVAAKRDIPAFPTTIGVVTSLAAAALRDILTTLKRRNPSIHVIVYPVPVQGNGAAEKIAAMLATASRRNECDVLLLARGGGSIEDLWQFNEEVVARAIRACAIPVVSGIGHETDFTIADFAADLRAPTPTAAAETVSPSRDALFDRLAELVERATRGTLRRLDTEIQRVDGLARRLVHPRGRWWRACTRHARTSRGWSASAANWNAAWHSPCARPCCTPGRRLGDSARASPASTPPRCWAVATALPATLKAKWCATRRNWPKARPSRTRSHRVRQ